MEESPPSWAWILLIGRRLFFIGWVCFGVIFLVHLGMGMVRNSEVRQPDYNIQRHALVAWQETRDYIGDLFGEGLGVVQRPYGAVTVTSIVRQAYLNSMGLLITALTTTIIFGLLLGLIVTLVKQQRIVLPLLGVTLLGISIPSFFAALLLRQGEILYLRTFGRPLVSVAGFGWDYQHMLLPVLVLAARPVAYLTRATFIALSRTLEEAYIRTAIAKGLTQWRTIAIHALPNIAVPILTAIGVSLRFSLSTLPIVEFFFLWPGLGLGLLEAIDARQTTIVVTLALSLGLTFLLVNLLLDAAYWIIDPRIREGRQT